MSRDAWEPLESAPDEHYVWLLYDFPKHGPTPVLGIRKPDPRLREGAGTHSWFGPPTIMWNGRLTEGWWIEDWIKGWKRFCDHSTPYSEAISVSGDRWVYRDSDTQPEAGDVKQARLVSGAGPKDIAQGPSQ